MPNGGSDCCGTCWFNRKNQGERDWMKHAGKPEAAYCEIRNVEIDNPFYTYCANHPHRRPEGDSIPIGPITQYAGDGFSNDREIWKLSPDTDEIRVHLLELIDGFFEHVSEDRYPIGDPVGQVIIWQLGQFREQRAVERLQSLRDSALDDWADAARESLAQIQAESSEG